MINKLVGFLLLLSLVGCSPTFTSADKGKITHINIMDRNGMSETISSPERLSSFQATDFFSPQPYEKVLRIFERNKLGEILSIITSYHPNGQIKQYLEARNNRACGCYKEWHMNGELKVESSIVGGVADINTSAEESWLFDGICKAWDECGQLIAEITYDKGSIEGTSLSYHPNGVIWKKTPYLHNQIHGMAEVYLEDGSLLQETEYSEGKKMGKSTRFWRKNFLAYEEEYEKDKLLSGFYLDASGNKISEIKEGCGFRAIFGKDNLQELQEFKNGTQEGEVKIFGKNAVLMNHYKIKNQEKEGEEILYFEATSSQPKLLMNWKNGILHGIVKAWYENGKLQSQKEICQNKRSGISSAWYNDGQLMFVEEYDNDLLIKGEYFRKGEKLATSTIEYGKGVATLFDEDGSFLKKVAYVNGKPDLPGDLS